MSTKKPSRPYADRQMIQEAAEEMALIIDADAATIARHYSHSMDGYELARELEKYAYWDVDRDMMEKLDEMEAIVDRKLKAAEKQWAEENDIQADLPNGTRVQCRVRKQFGFIDGTYEYGVARYLIRGERQTDDDNSRWIVKFEDAIPAPAEETQP